MAHKLDGHLPTLARYCCHVAQNVGMQSGHTVMVVGSSGCNCGCFLCATVLQRVPEWLVMTGVTHCCCWQLAANLVTPVCLQCWNLESVGMLLTCLGKCSTVEQMPQDVAS